MIRVLLLFALAIATVAACSLLYDPDRLSSSGSSTPDGDLGRGADAATDPDAMTHIDGAATTDSMQRDAAGHDAAVDATPIDAARIDAAVRDAAVDAAPPDAPSCGGTNEMCCPGNTCEQWHECTAGACRACGGLLESCCDPGASCRLGLCVGGICVSLGVTDSP